ncbi:MAG: sulfatase [Bacteroidota bacterium]
MKNLLFCIALLLATQSISAQDQPNIIWLMAEDIGLDLECYGMAAVKTPHLNKLAAEGIKFDNCFVTNPICSPSRSAMMTGTHQSKINAQHHRSNRAIPLDEHFQPFTYHLRKAGYTTILGHHGVMGKGRKIDCNFKHQALGEWDGETKFGLFDKFDYFEPSDQPFFAQIQLKATHRGDWWDKVRADSKHPVQPDEVVLPPFMADHPEIRLDWAKYLDQMEFIDAEVGMIQEELDAKGMADNTLIIFIGDNGRCNIRGKGYLHDPGLHIPLIVYYPKKYRGGKVRKDVVSATDITASILAEAGIAVPKYMTGTPIFDKKSKRKFVYGTRDLWDEVEEQSKALTSGKWKYIRNDKPIVPFDAGQAYLEFYRPAVHIMRTLNAANQLTEVQQFFFEKSKPEEELYNLAKDPFELNNLVDNKKYVRKLSKLRAKLSVQEKAMTPDNTIFKPVHPIAVDVLDWVEKTQPEAYQQMLDGKEIGYQKWSAAYKKQLVMEQSKDK